jgi:ketosteroid isomerase-like protein
MSDSADGVTRAFVRAINRQDVEALAELMTAEHRFTDSPGHVVEGREKMRAGWAAYFRMVPDCTIAVEETFRAGSSTAPPASLGLREDLYCER